MGWRPCGANVARAVGTAPVRDIFLGTFIGKDRILDMLRAIVRGVALKERGCCVPDVPLRADVGIASEVEGYIMLDVLLGVDAVEP